MVRRALVLFGVAVVGATNKQIKCRRRRPGRRLFVLARRGWPIELSDELDDGRQTKQLGEVNQMTLMESKYDDDHGYRPTKAN